MSSILSLVRSLRFFSGVMITLTQDPDLFDAAQFRLSRTEAVALDPQARLLLHVAAEVRPQG